MNRTVAFTAIATAFAAASAPAAAADRSFTVTGFDRVRVEGPYQVEVATGVAPFAKVTGPASALDGVSISVQGRTLVVRASSSTWGGSSGQQQGPVVIRLGTHELSEVWLSGTGSLGIDRVKGLSFGLAVQGSGSARIGEALVDQLNLGISGAAAVEIGGTVPKLTATVRGSSSLDAAGLSVKDAVIGAEGPALVKAWVSNSAKVDASGTAAVELAGRPACTVRVLGSATVSGCK